MSVNPIKTINSFIFEPLKYYYNFVRGFFSLNIEGIDPDDENALMVNGYFPRLYAVEIAGAGENVGFIPTWLIDSLASDFSGEEDGELVWVLIKDGLYKKNLIFTHNKKIATYISSNISSRMLNFHEIMNVLLSLYFNNDYYIDTIKRELKQKISIDFEDPYTNPVNTLNSLLRERVYFNYEKLKFYQAVAYDYAKNDEEHKFNIETFFSLNFKGALFTKVIFSKASINSELDDQLVGTSFQFLNRDKRHLTALKKLVDQGSKVMLNSVLCVYDDYGSSVASQAGQAASCTFDIVSADKRSLCNETPIFRRFRPFSRVVRKEFLYNYFSYNTKLDSDRPHLCGTTQSDVFANFGLKKATAKHTIPKQHLTILGTSGSGKTVTANYMLAMFMGYDYKTGRFHHLDETEHVIFDIKDSFYNVVKDMHKNHPDLIDMNDFDKNGFSYNIFDCSIIEKDGLRLVDESDLDFATILISLILSAGGNSDAALSEAESSELKLALRELYEKKSFGTIPISKIQFSHPSEYNELVKLGYQPHTLFENVKEEKFFEFKKPLLFNVVNLLKQWQTKYQIEKNEYKLTRVKKLLSNLETVDALKIFSFHSKLHFKNKKVIYFRTDSLVGGNDYGYMVFAMQSILAKMIKKRQHARRIAKEPRPFVMFWYEEARNIFSNKLFKEQEVFDRMINEWRSYDMVCCPVTQEPQHIPDTILNGFEIKILLVSGEDEEEKENMIELLSQKLSIGENRKALLKSLPKYTMLIMYGDGAFTFKFPPDPDFIKLIDT